MTQSLLVLDDEPDILRLMERIVKSSTSYKIQKTNNSLEFLNIIEERKFDLIITDLKMPGMTGFDILDFVQKNNRDELVVVCTAFGNQETAMDILAKGAFEYLSKPFRKEHIILTIERGMKYQRLRRENQILKNMLFAEPYEKAEENFKIEYISHMNKKYENDINRIAEKTGVKKEVLNEYISKSVTE